LDACFVVIDSTGQKLAYAYFEDEPGRRSAAKLVSKDEAQRIAVNIVKLHRRCLTGAIGEVLVDTLITEAWRTQGVRHGPLGCSRKA
jgi:hypothetical protein